MDCIEIELETGLPRQACHTTCTGGYAMIDRGQNDWMPRINRGMTNRGNGRALYFYV
jgi:hypothetical protein